LAHDGIEKSVDDQRYEDSKTDQLGRHVQYEIVEGQQYRLEAVVLDAEGDGSQAVEHFRPDAREIARYRRIERRHSRLRLALRYVGIRRNAAAIRRVQGAINHAVKV
jgi:hypothetical protein